MEEQDKSYFWVVIITTLALVAGIFFAVLEKQDINNYEAKVIQY